MPTAKEHLRLLRVRALDFTAAPLAGKHACCTALSRQRYRHHTRDCRRSVWWDCWLTCVYTTTGAPHLFSILSVTFTFHGSGQDWTKPAPLAQTANAATRLPPTFYTRTLTRWTEGLLPYLFHADHVSANMPADSTAPPHHLHHFMKLVGGRVACPVADAAHAFCTFLSPSPRSRRLLPSAPVPLLADETPRRYRQTLNRADSLLATAMLLPPDTSST